MKKVIFIAIVLLFALCACRKEGQSKNVPQVKTNPNVRTARKTPKKERKPAANVVQSISYDSYGAVTGLVFRCDYAKLASRPCFSGPVVAERLKTEKDNADLYFARALSMPENSLEREKDLKKASELQPDAPYPVLELVCFYGTRGEFSKARVTAQELSDFFEADKDLADQVIKRCRYWLKGFAMYDDTHCNDDTVGIMEILAPYDQKIARSVVRYYIVRSNEKKALAIIKEFMQAETKGEKLAWRELLECIDDDEARMLIAGLGVEEEMDALSAARSRLVKLQRELYKGNYEWYSEEMQEVRRSILLHSTNAEERIDVAGEYLTTSLTSDDSGRIEEYVGSLMPADTEWKRREFSILLESMNNFDMDEEAVRHATTLYVSAPPDQQPATLAQILKSNLMIDDDLIREAAELHPTDVKLITAVADYYKERKNYEEAAKWHRKLIALVKTDAEKNRVRAQLAEDLACSGDKSGLLSFYNETEEALSQGMTAEGRIALYKIRLGIEGTNSVWQEAAETFLNEKDPDAKAVLLSFLTGFQWNTVRNTKEMAPAITEAALAEPSPEILKSLPMLFERLQEVEAKPEIKTLTRFFLREGIKPPYYYELISLFSSREEALKELDEWFTEAKLGSLDLIDFYTSAVNYRIEFDDKSLALFKKIWDMTGDLSFRQRSSLFYCFYGFHNSEKVSKEKKEEMERALFESWRDEFKYYLENGLPTLFIADPGEVMASASEKEKREIMDLIARKMTGGSNYSLVNIYRGLARELGAEKEAMAVLEEHFSFEHLVKNPNDLWLYSNICDEMGKEFDKKKVLQEIVAAQTNIKNFAQSGLLYIMRENGLRKEADEICEKLLDEPGIPWYLKHSALYNIKNQDKRLEKTLEVAEAMPPGEGKNEMYFQVMNNCRGEKWKEQFKEAWEYLQTSKKEYVWDRLISEIGDTPYEVDAEQLFANYEKFLSERKDKEEVAKIVANSRLDLYTRLGDYDKAIKVGEELVLKEPGRAESLADLYIKKGQNDKAEEAYKNLLEVYEKACLEGDTSHREWLTSAINGLKEMCLNGQAELDEATLKRAFLSKDEPTANDYLEYVNAAQGIVPFSDLNECFEKARELSAADTGKFGLLDEWMNCARSYGDTNAYRKILGMRAEEDVSFMGEYIQVLSEQGRGDEALKKGFETWEKLKDSNEVWKKRNLEDQLFEICVKAGDNDKAWEVLSEKWKPDKKETYVYLDPMGIYQKAEKLGKGKEALENLEKYLESSGNAYSKLNNAMGLFNAYQKSGDKEAAIAFADRFIEIMPKNNGNPADKLELMLNSSHPEKGLDLIKEMAEDPDGGLQYRLRRVSAYFSRNKDREGEIEFLKNLPESFDQRGQLASVYANSGDENDRDKAKSLLKENLKDDEVESHRKMEARNRLLDLALTGEKDQYLINDLINDYNSDASLSKDERNRGLAEIYNRTQDYVKADNLYSEWLKETKDPYEKASIQRNYAAMLEKAGRPRDAIEEYNKLLASQAGDLDGKNSTREELIRLYAAEGDTIKAENIRRERITEYEKILANVPYGEKAKEMRAKIEAEKKAIEDAKTPKG